MSIVITSKITLGTQQFQVVGQDESLRKQSRYTRILIFSQEHVQVLLTKIRNLQDSGCNQDEVERLQKELDFINKHNEIHATNISGDLEDGDYDTSLTRTDTQDTTASISEPDNFHVSAETFGKLKNLKLIKVKDKREKLLRIPKVRQYVLNGVLHRELEEMKTTWYELFVDLVYVATISKASYLITTGGYNWTAFFHFFLVYSAIYSHWMVFSMYNNMFYHDDLYYKMFCYFMTCTLVIMSVSTGYAFDPVDAANTSDIFIVAFLISKLTLLISIFYLYYHMPKFRSALTRFYIIGQIVPSLLYIPVIFLDGDSKLIMWGVASIAPFVSPFLNFLFPYSETERRIAVNIEHLTERLGLLVVIVLGEIVFAFIYDHPISTFTGDIGLVLLCFLITSNLFYLYFRSETEPKYQHAIRRNALTGIAWNMMHFPLTLTLSAMGACLSGLLSVEIPTYILGQNVKVGGDFDFSKAATSTELTYKPEFTAQFRSVFVTSLGIIHICLAIMQLLHQEEADGCRQQKRIQNISQTKRIYGRALAGVFFIAVGNFLNVGPKAWLAIVAIATSFGVITEEYGRIRGRLSKMESESGVRGNAIVQVVRDE